MQVVFVLVSWASAQGHHHHFVFAKEHPREKRGVCEVLRPALPSVKCKPAPGLSPWGPGPGPGPLAAGGAARGSHFFHAALPALCPQPRGPFIIFLPTDSDIHSILSTSPL